MRRAVLAALLLLGPASRALAQETGGSVESSDFGSSSSSSSDYSSGSSSDYSSSSSSDYSSSSSDTSSGSSSSGRSSGSQAVGILLGVFFVMFGVPAIIATRRGPVFHVSALSLGLDWHARPEIQRKLRALATGRASRGELLGETVLALRRARDSWLYAGCRDGRVRGPAEAERAYRELGQALRARFKREVVRATGGEVREDAPPDGLEARPEEGPGLVVVSLVVASRRALAAFARKPDAEAIERALDSRAAVPTADLAGVEIIWSPAVDEDRMSSAELEQHYPELARLDPSAALGRTVCEYCGAPFPAERVTCPYCDGRAPSSEPRTATGRARST